MDGVQLEASALCGDPLHKGAVQGQIQKHGTDGGISITDIVNGQAKAEVLSDVREILLRCNAAVDKHGNSPTFRKNIAGKVPIKAQAKKSLPEKSVEMRLFIDRKR